MKGHFLFLVLSWSFVAFATAQAPPPAAPTGPAAPDQHAGPPLRSAADLEKLVAPIALYPDPLIATMLPASVYPLEIVQAARFVKDTNNLAKLDAQPWDTNVKAVARVPDVIQKMNTELSWTTELGEAFLAQDKDLFDAIQTLRGQAAQIGNLKTSPQQIVTVTNVVVEKTIEQKVVVVTNTVVQVQPANPEVVYVPQYSPTVVYTTPPPPDPTATLLTFGVGMLVGAAIADNNCDWHGGGCYHGGYHGDVDIDVNRVNINNNNNINANRNVQRNGAGQQNAGKKWQPDQTRLGKSGSPTAAAAARSGDARGWGAGAGGQTAGRSPQASAAGQSRSPGAQANAGGQSRSPGTQANAGGQSAGRSPQASPGGQSAGRSPQASASPSSASANARSTGGGASPGAPSASRSSQSASQSRPSPSASSSSSAFGGAGGGGGDARSASSRGSSSRGGGGRSGGGGRR